jgi:hypothetical protein
VDVSSVRFGPSGATEVHGRGHLEDVDGDGDLDMMLHFDPATVGLTGTTTRLHLLADLLDRRQIEGSDIVRIVP